MWRLSPPLRVIHKLERRNSWRAWDSKVNSGKTRSQETARKVSIFDHAHSPTFSPIVLPTFEFVLSQKFAWNSKRAHWTVHFRAFALHGGRSTGTRTGLIWILKNSTFYFETVYKLPFICCSSCVPPFGANWQCTDSVLTVYLHWVWSSPNESLASWPATVMSFVAVWHFAVRIPRQAHPTKLIQDQTAARLIDWNADECRLSSANQSEDYPDTLYPDTL